MAGSLVSLSLTALVSFLLAVSAAAAIGDPVALRVAANLEALDERPVLRINALTVIRSASVAISELADLTVLKRSDREALQDLVLAELPPGRDRLELPRAYVEERLREKLGPDRNLRFDLPERIVVELGERRLPGADIERFVVESLTGKLTLPEGVRIAATVSDPYEPVPYPRNGELKLELVHATPRFAKRISVAAVVRDQQGKVIDRRFVPVQLELKAQRWIAQRDLTAGESPSASDFKREETTVDLTAANDAIPEAEATFARFLSGARLKRAMAKGDDLSARLIERSIDLPAGSRVRVRIVHESGLAVTTSARAVSSGSLGQVVRARLEKSGRLVSGELIERDLMDVRL